MRTDDGRLAVEGDDETLVSSVAALRAEDVRDGRRVDPAGLRGAELIEDSQRLLLAYGRGVLSIASTSDTIHTHKDNLTFHALYWYTVYHVILHT